MGGESGGKIGYNFISFIEDFQEAFISYSFKVVREGDLHYQESSSHQIQYSYRSFCILDLQHCDKDVVQS